MSRQFINALKQKSLHIACDITGKFYISGYGGMGMECISPATEDSEIVILSLIEKGKLLQKDRVRYSPELDLDLKYYDYDDV
ncbi:hypothetical protein BM525_20230 (plasmid) [Alteromonas mediterranea]|uniref:Uncharacterized protein n=1 Tax=Alteromonas mediterranea TaxID=314275 RepID=A0AAC9NTT8_9ALTE|nr:hypothetical protein [Alteromonas mediterranea]APD92209.1 hypothetical protein BM524_20035 [Alteromonas mediterranea]APE00064.1 hypothetical protein BM525_20230 [Alteromonas mediterranea]